MVCGLPKTSSRKTSGLNWKALKGGEPNSYFGLVPMVNHPSCLVSVTCPGTAVPKPGAVTPTGVTALTSGVIKQTEIQLFVPVLGAASRSGAQHGKWGCNQTPRGEGWPRMG